MRMIDTDTGRALLANGAIYLTGEDHLRLTTIGALAGAVVALEGRLIDPSFRVVPIAERHIPTSDRTAATSVHGLGEGMLMQAQLRLSSGTGTAGHVFGILEIVRGLTGAVQPLATLLQGYISTVPRLAWPGSPIASALTPNGRHRVITGSDPAAGAEVSETVPAGARWRLAIFNFGLQASAAAANRLPLLTIDDGATILWQVGANVALTANLLGVYRTAIGATASVIGTQHYTLALPSHLMLLPGYRIRTVTTALDVADNYTAPIYVVEEFLDS